LVNFVLLDPDPDPQTQLNPDPIWIRIRIRIHSSAKKGEDTFSVTTRDKANELREKRGK